jgi:radical SAM/Cys-rich protein
VGVHVIDRCNLTILFEPGHEDLAQFLADQQVEIVASLPCYLEDNVDKQRGTGVFDKSMRALQLLNSLGYGRSDALPLNLVYNPQGPSLPPPQQALEADYRRLLGERFGIVFTRLYALANMPISRFGSHADQQGPVPRLHEHAARLRIARERRVGDVPLAGVGRLAGLSVRLRLQPDARPAAARGRQGPWPHCT